MNSLRIAAFFVALNVSCVPLAFGGESSPPAAEAPAAGLAAQLPRLATDLNEDIQALIPFAGSTAQMAAILSQRLGAPGATRTQAAAGAILIEALSQPEALPSVEKVFGGVSVDGRSVEDDVNGGLDKLARHFSGRPSERTAFRAAFAPLNGKLSAMRLSLDSAEELKKTLESYLAGRRPVIIINGVEMSDDALAAARGSGVAKTQTRDLASFDGIELNSSAEAVVKVGTRQSVSVEADDNLIDRVKTEVSGGRLIVRTSGFFASANRTRITISVPKLAAVQLRGSGSLRADGLNGGGLKIDLSGSGSVEASGRVDRLDVTVNGSGSANLRGLAAREAAVSVNGSGSVDVDAKESLRAVSRGSGGITYSGKPRRVDRQALGSGSIEER